MKLKAMMASNYKSFYDSQLATIGDGFNLFIGANNSGKTSMLEVLDFDGSVQIPHRSEKNLPDYGQIPTGSSKLSVTVEASFLELRDPASKQLWIPLPSDFQAKLPNQRPISDEILTALSSSSLTEVTYSYGLGFTELITNTPLGSQNASSLNTNNQTNMLNIEVTDTNVLKYISLANHGGGFPGMLSLLVERIRPIFYRFSAFRKPAGKCGPTPHPVVLAPDASNLPYCLNVLQSTDAHGYEILCRWVNRVFPSTLWIQASPRPENLFEIICLPLPPSARRDDLGVPLSLMGNGIGNVIAMLYVVLTSRFPKVIAIDEPNSFLHPRALRELLQILAVEGREHQFILTAHSADVINAVNPSVITIFNSVEGRTIIEQIKSSEVAAMRTAMSDLGIRLTDLHGRDRVLWVEGQTEELVIPELLRHFCPEVAAGTAVLRVEHTGTFDRKGVEAKEVANLYNRLTTSAALVPPMVAILLDSEKRSKTECQKLQRESQGVLRFLDKSMLENYLLEASAISHVLNCQGEQTSVEATTKLLVKLDSTANEADNAKILHSIFLEISEARLEFKKTRDVPKLVTWLLENEPHALNELGQFLRKIFALPVRSFSEVI